MKILFVYKYLTVGGVEAVLLSRLKGLELWGVEAHAWFFADHGGRAMFDEMAERVHLGSPDACMSFLSEEDFDLVSTIDTEEIFPAFTDNDRRRPLLVEAHSAYCANLDYLSRLQEVRPAAVLVPSAHHGSFIDRRLGGAVEVRVVPNPVHEQFVTEPAAFAPAPSRPALCWIGRLDDHKNWEGFLEIAGRLVEAGRDVEVWLVGQPLTPRGAGALRDLAAEAGVLGRLRWFRGVPHPAMPALYDAVRDSGGVVVTTSRGESFGMTVAEAMARRCPVVVPDEGPFTELVEHGKSGLCFLPGSTASAVEQVEAMLASGGLRRSCGWRARKTILARFAPRPALAQLTKHLRSIAGRPYLDRFAGPGAALSSVVA